MRDMLIETLAKVLESETLKVDLGLTGDDIM